MSSIEFKFEETPLVLADYSGPTPYAIGLISGTAEITFSRVYGDDSAGLGAGFEFDIESVDLSSPIAGWPNTKIKWARTGTVSREIWNCITRSIERAHTDDIYEAIGEACQPDPDAAYEARRDDERSFA